MARKAGTVNKDRGRVLRAIRNYAGEEFDPAIKLIELAMRAEEGDKDNDIRPDLALASANYGKLMEYCYPKLRAIEIEGEIKARAVELDYQGFRNEDNSSDPETE